MKKFLLAVIVIAGIAACNSPQEISTGSDSTGNMSTRPMDSGSTMRTDTMMQGDTMKTNPPR